ncbi:unnamed protein product [Meganyctiphanes norvegica]|uniref:Uncharacterized protein n=1 Tax=Meganyctiphanes norvegica TaxID=48144 RepID=A0AAV2QHX1_MEGNR
MILQFSFKLPKNLTKWSICPIFAIFRYAFLVLCILAQVLTKSTQSDLVWKPVGLQVNDLEIAKINLKADGVIVNNSISLDMGCDHALNEAGGLSYLEAAWYESSKKGQADGKKLTEDHPERELKFFFWHQHTIVLKGCWMSRSSRRCSQCVKMRLYKGRYYCCNGSRCRERRIPRLKKECGLFSCTIYCDCTY